MTLAEFLLARIGEDEAEAKEHQHYEGEVWEAAGWWDCTRVLAECDAKRRIVELHEILEIVWRQGIPEYACQNCDVGDDDHLYYSRRQGCATLRLLALPYSDHPDYQENWKP
jgi:hypothetical protein